MGIFRKTHELHQEESIFGWTLNIVKAYFWGVEVEPNYREVQCIFQQLRGQEHEYQRRN